MKRTYFKAMMLASVLVGSQALGADLQTMPNGWMNFLGNAYNTTKDNVQTGYALTAQSIANGYHKVKRSCKKLIAGKQPHNPLERIETLERDIPTARRNEKLAKLGQIHADDYLTASANAAAKTVKAKAELQKMAVWDTALDRSALAHAKKEFDCAQAELNQAVKTEKYINASASAYAKAHKQAELNKAAKGVGFYTAVAAGVCGIASKKPAAIRQAVINARKVVSGNVSTRYSKSMNMERLGLLN